MFAQQIGKTMEVYMNDILVKSLHAIDHPAHLVEMFDILYAYSINLNPNKCAFRISHGNFLGFMIN